VTLLDIIIDAELKPIPELWFNLAPMIGAITGGKFVQELNKWVSWKKIDPEEINESPNSDTSRALLARFSHLPFSLILKNIIETNAADAKQKYQLMREEIGAWIGGFMGLTLSFLAIDTIDTWRLFTRLLISLAPMVSAFTGAKFVRESNKCILEMKK